MCPLAPFLGMPPLSIPQLLLDQFRMPQDGGLGTQLYISIYNTLFIFVAVCVAYAMVGGASTPGCRSV